MENSLPHKTSGYTYRTRYVLKGQLEQGFTPIVATRPGFPEKYGRGTTFGLARPAYCETVDGIVHHRAPARYSLFGELEPLDIYLQRYAECVFDAALHGQVEFIQAATDFKNGIAACAAARRLGIPWVYEVRGLWEETRVSNGTIVEGSEGHRFLREQETWCMYQADAIVTLSKRLKDEIVSRGVDSEKVFVVPNGVDVRQFPVVTRDVELANGLDLGNGLVIGYVSTLTAYEGVETLVRAFAAMVASRPELRLVIVGDGEMSGRIAHLVDDLGIQTCVRLTGRISHDEVLKYYSLIDVFVVPRLPNRVCEIVTPLKPYEAMSTGRAVVMSDVGGLAEIVKEGGPAVLFKAGDIHDLVVVCLDLIKNPEKRSRLGAAAAQWVRSNRTWSANTQVYREVYAFARARQSGSTHARDQ